MAKGKYFYQHQGRTHGPLSSGELRRRATSGQLLPSDLIWKEGHPKRVFASQLPQLFPPPVPPADTLTSSSPPKLSSLQSAAVLASKQAQLQSLKWDLSCADERLGAAAVARHLGASVHSDLYQAVAKLDQSIAAKRQTDIWPGTASITAQARRLANDAKKKIDIETLLAKRQKQLRQLGERLREDPSPLAGELSEELLTARHLADQLTAMKPELAALAPLASHFKRRFMLSAIGIAGLVLLYIFSDVLLAWHRTRQEYAYINELTRQAALEQEKLEAAAAERQRQHALELEQEEASRRRARRRRNSTKLDGGPNASVRLASVRNKTVVRWPLRKNRNARSS